MKDQIDELKKLLRQKSTTDVEKKYAEDLITWLTTWINKGKPGVVPADDPGDHPPPPPPHK